MCLRMLDLTVYVLPQPGTGHVKAASEAFVSVCTGRWSVRWAGALTSDVSVGDEVRPEAARPARKI